MESLGWLRHEVNFKNSNFSGEWKGVISSVCSREGVVSSLSAISDFLSGFLAIGTGAAL